MEGICGFGYRQRVKYGLDSAGWSRTPKPAADDKRMTRMTVSTRLYDTAWVSVEGIEHPLQVQKDRRNPAAFIVGDYSYDIDGRPLASQGPLALQATAPKILNLHSLQSAREAGLRINVDVGAAYPEPREFLS